MKTIQQPSISVRTGMIKRLQIEKLHEMRIQERKNMNHKNRKQNHRVIRSGKEVPDR